MLGLPESTVKFMPLNLRSINSSFTSSRSIFTGELGAEDYGFDHRIPKIRKFTPTNRARLKSGSARVAYQMSTPAVPHGW